MMASTTLILFIFEINTLQLYFPYAVNSPER